MKHNYLWDKSGPPDPEMARLERTFNALRHTPGRPAWLEEFTAAQQTAPAARNVVPFVPRRSWRQFFQMPQLAVAATVAVCVLAAGLWFGVSRRQSPESAPVADAAPEIAAKPVTVAPPQDKEIKPRLTATVAPRRVVLPARVVKAARATVAPVPAVARVARPKPRPQDEITPEEARKAQADLALALQVINDRLNQAQKSIEGRTIKIPELAGDTR